VADKLQFRRVTGEPVEAEAQVDDEEIPAGEFLMARRVWLDDGTELRQHRVAKGSRRSSGYDRLDNEILAGRRLHEAAESGGYPPEVARLYGDEATSADSYALLEPYRGEPLSELGTHLLEEEQEAFEASLLTGLCWLAAAGIAHRALSPDTVLWDSQRRQAQITDFSLSTVFGVPREAIIGSPNWVAREQRPGSVSGAVSDRDDIWAAGRLIFFVRNQGEHLGDRGQLANSGLGELLAGVFDPPESRPTARELLVDRMGQRNPIPRGAERSAWLKEGHRRFWEARKRKHPDAAVPPEADQDADGPGRTTSGATGNAAFLAGARTTVATDLKAIDGRAPADAAAREAARPRHFRWRRGGG
jgi:hypothetical protein